MCHSEEEESKLCSVSREELFDRCGCSQCEWREPANVYAVLGLLGPSCHDKSLWRRGLHYVSSVAGGLVWRSG
ncbi:hypothetical protein BaRGS_00029690, partial [Batillaria attramentaria]